MKFPRNAKILRSPFEMAPFAAMFFLLVIFLLLAVLLPTPGIPLRLPVAGDLPGVGGPTTAVAVDAGGRFYFADQIVSEAQLISGLSNAVKNAPAPLTLVIRADKTVREDQLFHLALLARQVGITNSLLAALPGAPARPAGHE